MTEQVVLQRRSLRPLYYPSDDAPDFVRYTAPRGNPNLNARNRFDLVRAEDTWHAGPLSQKMLVAQLRWAELKMWILFHRIQKVDRAEWPELLSVESRLACSWFFQSDCMATPAMRLARRVRNEFFLKADKSLAELKCMLRELLRPC